MYLDLNIYIYVSSYNDSVKVWHEKTPVQYSYYSIAVHKYVKLSFCIYAAEDL